MMKTSRRRFLGQATAVTSGFLGLQRLIQSVSGQTASSTPNRAGRTLPYQSEVERYGSLIPDPYRILDLPKGFRYTVLSRPGEWMNDGLRTPGLPDGMAAFPGPEGKIILVRNHEVSSEMLLSGPFPLENGSLRLVDRAKMYDAGEGIRPHLGGTTTLLIDPRTLRVERQYLSLAGTCRNCAGGPTPWNSWITCEETVELSAEAERRARARRPRAADAEDETEPAEPELRTNYNEKSHGYNFEVPARADGALADPIPLTAMGRFNHEAVAVDPATGIVYQTEDRDDGLIYRFIPKVPGRLAQGGRLQALAIRGKKSTDTRNWPSTGKPKIQLAEVLETEWIDMDNVESPRDDLRTRGHGKGAARFARGEGMWHGQGEIFFACTNGGISKTGQIFRYRPSPYEGTKREVEAPGKLVLYLEPNNTHLLQSCDNLTIAPWGDLIICEDGPTHNYLRGVTPEGKAYTLAASMYHTRSELCGACFAPDHPILFVNLQVPGLTLAVTGPWQDS